MRHLLFSSCLVLLAAAAPALAQQVPDPTPEDKGKYEIYPSITQPDEDAAKIMTLNLPLLDNQTVRYFNGNGDFVGLARRHGLTISFFDAQGNYIGRAQRLSQRLTEYYDANGNYLGRRINQRLVTSNTSTAVGGGWKQEDAGSTP